MPPDSLARAWGVNTTTGPSVNPANIELPLGYSEQALLELQGPCKSPDRKPDPGACVQSFTEFLIFICCPLSGKLDFPEQKPSHAIENKPFITAQGRGGKNPLWLFEEKKRL